MMNKMLQVNDSKTTIPRAPRLLVAMELSLKTWRLAMSVAGQEKKRVKTVAGGHYEALAEVVREVKTRWALPAGTDTVFCYEAGRDGFYPYRRLTGLGHTVWVIDSSSIEVSRKQRRAKSDGIDADKLLALMQRQARGEPALRVVRVPSAAVEDERLLPRERAMLLGELQRLRNRIESLLFTQGYREVPASARGLRAWLQAPRELGAQLRERLSRDLDRLVVLEAQLHAVEKALRDKTRDASPGALARIAALLMRVCGIGWVGAWVLASEIYGWRTFRNRREVGGALGLTPTPYSSGQDTREQGISKAGNARARAILVELAWLWLRYQPDSALSQWFLRRFSGGGKRLRRIGIVALARRLGVALWRYVAQDIVPEGARLKAVAA
jgi:transposase